MTDVTTKATDAAITPARAGWTGLVAAGIALTAVVAVIRWSLGFLTDLDAPARTIAGFYDLFGAERTAEAVRASGLGAGSNKAIIAVVALVVGVAGVWALFISANTIVDRLSETWSTRLRPWVFAGPAVALLTVFLVYPAFNTIITSLTEDIVPMATSLTPEAAASPDVLETMTAGHDRVHFGEYWLNGTSVEIAAATVSSQSGDSAVLLVLTGDTVRTIGLSHYGFVVTDPGMRIALRNNLIWLILGTSGSVVLGLLIATLVDRVKREALAKTFVFLPMAISMVGAAVIWRFMYYWRPPGQTQIGVLNAVKTGLGGEPTAWVQTPPLNTMALIVIMVWLLTGFAMVILSAALKGVPSEIVEAGRIDGASEPQLFFRVIIPSIRPSIITVATTIFIAILKVFDIVFVMTGGRFDTEVVANRMFTEMFRFRNYGRASALAVVLLVVTIPIMVINVRNLRRQGVEA